jgi:hypothetical protein
LRTVRGLGKLKKSLRKDSSVTLFRRILLLGYTTGLQIWDCTILGSVSEILNLTDYPFGSVTFAGVLLAPHHSRERDYDGSRPLIGVMCVNLYADMTSTSDIRNVQF